MFYVCEQRGNLYGVADTDDGICEFYFKEKILNLARKVGIMGVSVQNRTISVVGIDAVLAKLKMIKGSSDEVNFEIALNTLDNYEIVSIGSKLTMSGCSYFLRIYNCTTKEYLPLVKSLKVFPKLFLNKNIHITNLIRENGVMYSSCFLEATEIYVYHNKRFITIDRFLNEVFILIRNTLNTVVGGIDNVYYACKSNTIYINYFYYAEIVTLKYDIPTMKLTQLKSNRVPASAINVYSRFK